KSITGGSSGSTATTVVVGASVSIETNQVSQISTEMFEISSQVSLCSTRAKLQISLINNNKVTITVWRVDFLFGLMNYSISNPSLSCSSPDGSSGCRGYNVSICPDNSTDFICNDTFLKFYQEPISWIKALQKCYKLRSRLVPITNKTVWRDFKSLLKNKTGLKNGVWVGLERSIFGTNAEWKWISGMNADPKWNSTFPVDRFNNHCGKVVWVEQIKKHRLLDANCHDELPFICQALPVNGN
ncbi:hypothetical protein ATANTOWER_012122, partial [Ataeniobius toweri]|nr:hypothetical protein [Ataeniobius toweri]